MAPQRNQPGFPRRPLPAPGIMGAVRGYEVPVTDQFALSLLIESPMDAVDHAVVR